MPERDGLLHFLAEASAAGVGRMVLTSSIAAIINGHSHAKNYLYSEKDWTNLEEPLLPK